MQVEDAVQSFSKSHMHMSWTLYRYSQRQHVQGIAILTTKEWSEASKRCLYHIMSLVKKEFEVSHSIVWGKIEGIGNDSQREYRETPGCPVKMFHGRGES